MAQLAIVQDLMVATVPGTASEEADRSVDEGRRRASSIDSSLTVSL